MFAQEIAEKFPDLWQAWRSDPSGVQMPGGESLAQVHHRVIAAFNYITEANHGQQILVVTHDVIVRLLVSLLSQCEHRRLPSPGGGQCLPDDNSSGQ